MSQHRTPRITPARTAHTQIRAFDRYLCVAAKAAAAERWRLGLSCLLRGRPPLAVLKIPPGGFNADV